ncbi:unnamed protein product [Camellia sinensis]
MEGKFYQNNSLEWEFSNFIKVWLSVIVSLCYCHVAAKVVPKGLPRLLIFIPVICLFLALPLSLYSMHLGGICSFFIAWLTNFKLLSLAFGKGPLSEPSLSLPKFLAIGCFPIKIQQNPPPKTTQTDPNKENPSPNKPLNQETPSPQNTQKGHKSLGNYAIKIALVAMFVHIEQGEYVHPKLMLVMYCLHIYFMLELMLAAVAAVARATLNLELEPQFNDPYLSTSLQDFWGRRWNIMVSRTLHPTVYDPVRRISTRIVGRKWAPLPAVFSTFVVSALMHELIFYYLGRNKPTWEMTWFFVLHGACMVIEITVKKAMNGRCQLPPVVTRPLTLGFVMVTGYWLFFPEFFRIKADVRAFEEYALVGAYLTDVVGGAANLGLLNATRA